MNGAAPCASSAAISVLASVPPAAAMCSVRKVSRTLRIRASGNTI